MDTIELSFGKVKTKELTRYMVREATKRTITKFGFMNNEEFIGLIEDSVVKIPFWKKKKISYQDGKVIREYIRNILISEGILSENVVDEKPDLWSKKDVEWFNDSYKTAVKKAKGGKLNE